MGASTYSMDPYYVGGPLGVTLGTVARSDVTVTRLLLS